MRSGAQIATGNVDFSTWLGAAIRNARIDDLATLR